MKNIFASAALLSAFVLFFSCKKPPVDSKVFVERYLEGAWQIKATVFLDQLNGDTLRNDSLILQYDTVAFTRDSQFWRMNSLVPFSVDETGENMKFSTLPDSTWHIDYMKKNEFRLLISKSDTLSTGIYDYRIYRIFAKRSLY